MTEPTKASPPASQDRPPLDPIDAALDAIAGHLRRLLALEATGELAALRRLDPARPDTIALVRVSLLPAVDALLAGTANEGARADLLARLAIMVRAMAGAEDLHGGWKLGRALSDIGATERRVDTLLTARGLALLDVVHRTAARLSREGPLPYRQLGRLVLGDTLDPKSAEATRFEIARDFARSQSFAARDNA